MNENINKLEKKIFRLQAFCVIIVLVGGGVLLMGFSSQKKQKFGEIDVERINIVEKDGKLKMVISNQERQHPGVAGGKIIERKEPRSPGILFFNDVGDECGGLAYEGEKNKDGKIDAYGGLTFDQFGQDETIKLFYGETGNYRHKGLYIQDRSLIRDPEYSEKYKAVKAMPDGPEKTTAMKPLLAPSRLFVGTEGNYSMVVLNDKDGNQRIKMIVDDKGNPKLEFLDEKGNVISSLPDASQDKKNK
ncbi:MAG: hypothetical protein ABI891_14605 [Acidobacteriota bacterium]